MNESQLKKSKFRKSKVWSNLRKSIMALQKDKDIITLSKLRKGFVVHHKDLRESHYQNVEDEERFCAINSETHRLIHSFFIYYKKDGIAFIQRLIDLWEEMLKYSSD